MFCWPNIAKLLVDRTVGKVAYQPIGGLQAPQKLHSSSLLVLLITWNVSDNDRSVALGEPRTLAAACCARCRFCRVSGTDQTSTSRYQIMFTTGCTVWLSILYALMLIRTWLPFPMGQSKSRLWMQRVLRNDFWVTLVSLFIHECKDLMLALVLAVVLWTFLATLSDKLAQQDGLSRLDL